MLAELQLPFELVHSKGIANTNYHSGPHPQLPSNSSIVYISGCNIHYNIAGAGLDQASPTVLWILLDVVFEF